MEEKKLCPYCGEEILAVAKKCKHCGEWLDKKENVETGIEAKQVPEKNTAFKKWWIAILIILAVVIGLFVVVSNHQSESDNLAMAERTDPVINFAEPDEDDVDDADYHKDNARTQSAPKAIVTPKTTETAPENYDTEELLNLGESYEKGEGVEEDHATAFYYYEKAAKTGDPAALNKLGNMYAQGKGCTKDAHKAATYYLAAAEKGNKYAQHNIAFCYWDGVGVQKNRETAIMWMRRSAAQGFEKAKKALKTMGVE